MENLYYPNPDCYVDGRWLDMSATDILCERCKTVIVPKFTPYRNELLIWIKSKKGRILKYCSKACLNKHHKG